MDRNQFNRETFVGIKLLCFRHLSEGLFFLPGALRRRRKFANLCHDLIQNLCRNYICTNSFILFISFENSNSCTFSIVKMTANYAEIGRVGKLEGEFQQNPFVQTF